MKRADTKLMKEINKNLIRSEFLEQLEATASELSQKVKLSIVTVNALLKEMIEDKEVFEGGSIPSKGGRPSMVYRYNSLFKCAAIIYGFSKNNQDYINLIVINLLGECIHREVGAFERIIDNSFDEMLDRAFAKYPTIEVISFGLPGAEENGIITINDYPDIIGDTFMKHYEERYSVPVVFVNDINAAANGYYNYHLNNQPEDTVSGIFFPRVYPPGAGTIINGEIYTGTSNFPGEFGNMPIGVDWLELDYKNTEEVSDAIGKVVAITSCILAPKHFVLYGDFWQKDSGKKIKERAEKLLNNKFEVNIVLSNDFERDYELGMIKVALGQLRKYLLI